MELRGLAEVELVRIRGIRFPELLGQAEEPDGVLQEIGGSVEVGELERLGVDGGEGFGELGSDAAEGGLEGGDGGADGGEGEVGGLEGGELGEEVVVAGEDLGAELGFEEADGGVELLGGGGRGAGGEGRRGEGGGGEGRGEEGREDRVEIGRAHV